MGMSEQIILTGNRPVISIVIPTYNTIDYIDECLESVAKQTIRDIEIIVVDDCSTDGTIEKLDAWAKKDSRIQVVKKS